MVLLIEALEVPPEQDLDEDSNQLYTPPASENE